MRLFLLGAALALAACRSPLNRPAPRAPVPEAALPGPTAPHGPGARALFFQGLKDVESPLASLRARPTPHGTPPAVAPLPDVEAAVRQRYPRGTSAGLVREPLATGFSAWFPLPPQAMADLITDPAMQKRAFHADTFQVARTVCDVPGSSRRLMIVEMLRVGEGPVRFDFKFALALERLDLADGSVLLRYDPASWQETEHVTLFRGVATIEPSGTGSQVTELLIFGSDVSVPFFLRSRMRETAYDTFRSRAGRIWETASRRASGQSSAR